MNVNLFIETKNSSQWLLFITNPEYVYLMTYEIQQSFSRTTYSTVQMLLKGNYFQWMVWANRFKYGALGEQISRFFPVKPGMAHGRVCISMRPNSPL